MTTSQTTDTTVGPLVGDVVVVTDVDHATTSSTFREWVIGREGIVRRIEPATGTSSVYEVEFPDRFTEARHPAGTTPAGEPELRWVKAAQAVTPGDTITVGQQYTGPRQREHRCMVRISGRGVYCSRPKYHGTGPHVAAINHDGEVVEVWPNTTGDVTASEPAAPQAGDRVRVTAVAATADDDFRAHIVGATGRLVVHGQMAGAPYVVNLDDQYRYAGATEWNVAAIELLTEPETEPEVKPEPARTDNGSPILPVGSRIIIREAYREDDYPDRQRLRDLPAITITDPDADGDVYVRSPEGEPWPTTWDRVHVRRWDAAPSEADVTASEPAAETPADAADDTAAQEAAKDDYVRLANAAVNMAVDKDWCSEFEHVMRSGGFEEVACNRHRTWNLTIEFEYDFDTDEMGRAISHVFGGAEPEVSDLRTTVTVTAEVTWTGDDPDRDLDTDDLNGLLADAGYMGYDESSTSLYSSEDTGDDETVNVVPDLGASATWVARKDAFEALLAHEARERGWGQDLAEVYSEAGLPAPRAATLTVEVTAKRAVYRHEDSEYGRLLRENDAPDHMTLHKRLRFDIPNPFEDSDCHCEDRVENSRGEMTSLPAVLITPVIDTARAQLRDLYGDKHAGWTADHTDVNLTCMYCA